MPYKNVVITQIYLCLNVFNSKACVMGDNSNKSLEGYGGMGYKIEVKNNRKRGGHYKDKSVNRNQSSCMYSDKNYLDDHPKSCNDHPITNLDGHMTTFVR